MRIALGADHAGYQLKDSLKRLLDEMGVPYEDFGTNTGQSVDYPDFARLVAEGVAAGRFDRGILVCGTGVGVTSTSGAARRHVSSARRMWYGELTRRIDRQPLS